MSYRPNQRKNGKADVRKRKTKQRLMIALTCIVAIFGVYVAYAMQLPEQVVFADVVKQTAMPQDELALAGGDAPDLKKMPDSEVLQTEIKNIVEDPQQQFDLVWNAATAETYQIAQKTTAEINMIGMLDFVHADVEQALPQAKQETVSSNGEFIIENNTWNTKIAGTKIDDKQYIHFDKMQNDEKMASYDIIFSLDNQVYVEVVNFSGSYKGAYRMVLAEDNVLLYSRFDYNEENPIVPFEQGCPSRYSDFISADSLIFATAEGEKQIAAVTNSEPAITSESTAQIENPTT